MVLSSWFNPFPLLPDGHGGYSDVRNSMLFDTGLCTAFLTVGLAVFGRGRSRLLLAASGLVLAFVAFAALLSNVFDHVMEISAARPLCAIVMF